MIDFIEYFYFLLGRMSDQLIIVYKSKKYLRFKIFLFNHFSVKKSIFYCQFLFTLYDYFGIILVCYV